MEAACESGRHAVNAILDHYIWVQTDGRDRRGNTTLGWKFPYGFLDQNLSSPIRLPTPAGDYCYVFDIENREPADTRALRTLDSKYYEESLPHPLDTPAPHLVGIPPSCSPPLTGGNHMSAPSPDYYQQMLACLQVWRDLLERSAAATARSPFPGALEMPFMPGMPFMSPGMPAIPPMPGMPPMPPTVPLPPSPSDYTQQLFGYLQASRRHGRPRITSSRCPKAMEPSSPVQTISAIHSYKRIRPLPRVTKVIKRCSTFASGPTTVTASARPTQSSTSPTRVPRTVGSPFRAAIDRAVPKAVPVAAPRSLFKNAGQTP